MATRQSASKSARPVVASPTSKPSASKPQQANPAPESASTTGTALVADTRPPTAVSRALSPVASALRAVVNWCGGGLPFATILFSVLGFADSVYLTIQHFTAATAFVGCSDRGTINCEAVTTSAWSHLPAGSSGIPVSVAGLAFFVLMLAINSRWGWRARWAPVHWVRLVSVLVGIAMVLYLVWAELFRINAICLYCTGVHIITFILFALIISRVVMSGVRGTGTTDNG